MSWLFIFIALPLVIEVLRGKRFSLWHVLAMLGMAAMVLQGRLEFVAILWLAATAFAIAR